MSNLFSRFLAPLLARRRRLLWLLLLGVVMPWSIFLKASSEIEEGEGFYGDLPLLRWAHAHATPTLDALNLLFSRIGGPWPMTAASLLFTGGLLWRKQRCPALFFGVAVVGAAVLNLVAKALLGRPRPAFWPSLAPETSFSFPSGHAMGSAALVLALGFLLALAGVGAGGAVRGVRGLFARVPGGALPQRRALGLDSLAGLGGRHVHPTAAQPAACDRAAPHLNVHRIGG